MVDQTRHHETVRSVDRLPRLSVGKAADADDPAVRDRDVRDPVQIVCGVEDGSVSNHELIHKRSFGCGTRRSFVQLPR